MPKFPFKCRCGKTAECDMPMSEYLERKSNNDFPECECGMNMEREWTPVGVSWNTTGGTNAGCKSHVKR